MALLDQVQTLVSGTTHINLPAVRQQIGFAEQQTPEGTPVQLQLAFQPVAVGGITVPLARLAAEFVNGAVAAGQIAISGESIHPWPGELQIASYDDGAGTTTLHWLHGQEFSPLLIGLLVGLAVVGSIVLYLYVRHWSFGQLVQAVATTPVAGVPLEDWVLAAGVLLIGIPLVRRL